MKKILILPIFLFVQQCAFSQVVTQHSKKYFVSQESILYWNKELPMFLFLSDNAEGNQPVKLNSEAHKEFTNPMYLDTEGVNFIRTKWAVDPATGKTIFPKFEMLFEVYRDGISPISKITFNNAPSFQQNSTNYFGKGLKLDLTALDSGSGIEQSYLSKNKTDYKAYKSTQDTFLQGAYEISAYSVDNVGNVETPIRENFTVDTTSPSSSVTVQGDQLDSIYSTRSSIELIAEDALSGVSKSFYYFDSNEPKEIHGHIKLSGLSEGKHSLSYYSIDNVSNQESANKLQFTLDMSSPKVELTIIGDQYNSKNRSFISGRTELSLAAKDALSGVNKIEYSVDNNKYQEYESRFKIPNKDGSHHISYFATDGVMNNYRTTNRESDKGEKVLFMDINAPVIKYSLSGAHLIARDTTFLTSQTSIVLSARDEGAGIQSLDYSFDNNPNNTTIYEVPFTIPKEGSYTVQLHSSDNVNNSSEEKFVVVVDNTGPECEMILSTEPIGTIFLKDLGQKLDVISQGALLYLAATDQIVDTEEIYYKINNNFELKYDTPIKLREIGVNKIIVWATDQLGNQSEPIERVIYIQK